MMSRAEAGKLGGIASIAGTKARSILRIQKYELSPKICKFCQNPIAYHSRKNDFCSRTCSAKLNNSIRPGKSLKYPLCLICGRKTKRALLKFCSNLCHREYIYQNETKIKIQNGEITTRNTLKNYLIKEVKNRCFECDSNEWRGHSLSLELDHIDGNANNNSPSNIRLVCPNCHSITPSWKGRNRGKGRKSLGLPVN